MTSCYKECVKFHWIPSGDVVEKMVPIVKKNKKNQNLCFASWNTINFFQVEMQK